jgi:hypothetical protein
VTSRQAREVAHLLSSLTEPVDVTLTSGRIVRVGGVDGWGQDMGEDVPYLLTFPPSRCEEKDEAHFFYADEVVSIRAARPDGVVFDASKQRREVG